MSTAKGIDGAVNGIGAGFRAAGGGLRRLQTGLVRNYALGIVFGTVLLRRLHVRAGGVRDVDFPILTTSSSLPADRRAAHAC